MTSEKNRARDALARLVRHVPGFPEPGVVFQDLTPVLADAQAFGAVVDALARGASDMGADLIGGLDARGFLLGSAVAYKLGLGCLAIRKKGKLPPPVFTQNYALEYGADALEIPAEAIELRDKRVVLIDDVLATGGTLVAATRLLRAAGAEVTGYAVVLEVPGLHGRARLEGAPLLVLDS